MLINKYLRAVFFYILIILFASSCSKKTYYPTQIKALELEEPGTVTMQVTGQNKNKEEASKNAFITAFSVLMFQGLPNSIQTTPMVDNKEESMKNHPDFYRDFFKKDYTFYTLTSSVISEPKKVNGIYYTDLNIKINLNAFRKLLEDNKIIRKFGY